MDEKKDLVAFYNDLIEHVIRHADQEDDVLELFSDFFRYEQFRHGLRNEMVTINTYYFTPEEYRAICTILINQINRLLEKHKLRFDYEISDCEFRLTRLVKVNHVKVNIPEKTRVRTVIDQAEQALESAFYDQIPGLIGKALEVQLKSVFKKHHLTLKDNDGKMKAIDAIQNPNLKSLGNLLEEFKNQKFHEDSERNNEIHRLVNALEEPLKISNFIRPIWGMRCNVSVHPSVDDENERKNQLSVLKRHHAELILNAGITLSNFIYECFLANDDNEATLSAHPQSK
ncbi:MAG: hypothetical protein MJ218_03695 [Opitutales bacterium]|nr:hypothetical protein [Opitutales bacterium]